MKKFFAVLLVALFGAMPLFADDAADVKATILKSAEAGLKGDYSAVLAFYTPDFQSTTPEMTINYEMSKTMFLAMDGKHPEEFLTFTMMVAQELKLSEEMKAKIREAAKSPEFMKQYETLAPMMRVMAKIGVGVALKTIKFVSFKVDGDNATAVYEALTVDKNGDVKEAVCTTSLRRVNGAWLICRSVMEYK